MFQNREEDKALGRAIAACRRKDSQRNPFVTEHTPRAPRKNEVADKPFVPTDLRRPIAPHKAAKALKAARRAEKQKAR